MSVVSRVALAGLAGTVDTEGVSSTIALTSDDIVDFVGPARDAADPKCGIIECVSRALSANSSKQVVS